MRLPPSMVRERLEQVGRGAVIRVNWDELDDPRLKSRDKLLVLLNAAWPEAEILFAFATSRAEGFVPGKASDFLWISSGSYPFFPKETLINLRRVYVASFDRMCARPGLSVAGRLSTEHLARIDEIVSASRLIEARIKLRVVP
jgi:hypothetical protein